VKRLVLLAVWLGACGSAPPPAPAPAPPPPKPVAELAPAKPKNTLSRKDVVSFVNAGFWRFLQHVEVEPSLEAGRFRGWTVVALRPPTFWEGVDLGPGDIVTSVNDLPIERETEAFDAFESLRTADRLNVAYFRNGAQRRLAFRIVD